MFCTNCGRELPDDVKFCTSCGAEIRREGNSPQLSSAPWPITPQSPAQQPSPKRRSNVLPIVILAVVAAVALGGVGAYALLNHLAAQQATPSEPSSQTDEPEAPAEGGPAEQESSPEAEEGAPELTVGALTEGSGADDPTALVEEGEVLLAQCEQSGDQSAGTDAVAAFTRASILGNAEADYYLAYCYYYSCGVTRDYGRAYAHALVAAEADDARAQALVARCLYDGSGVAQDREACFEWAYRAAEQGDPSGQSLMGNCYKHGYGVEKDLDQMVYWYNLSAEADNEAGLVNMGACYHMGLGVPKDVPLAVEYYTRSAEKGNSLAQFYLAECYYDGDGVARDVDRAREYAEQAVNNVRDPRAAADASVFLSEHGL